MTRHRQALAPALITSLFLLGGCAETPSAAGQLPASPSQDQVVAEIGGRKITLKEVDEKWEQFDAPERARVTQMLYQNRRNMLDQLVGDVLIEDAAKAAKMPVDAFLTQETAKRAQPVSEAEVQAFFDQNKDRAGNKTIVELRKPIQDFLEGQRRLQARAQLVDDLRNTTKNIRVMLDPPRYTVDLVAHDPIRGDAKAPITIVEFSDYQCPFCARATPTLLKVREAYGDKVRIVFKDFPLPNHAQAYKASEAAHCAGDQGKYWEMHDRMFADQRALEVPALKSSAAALGLNAAAFGQCLDSSKYHDAVQEDMTMGEKMGVNSTPTIYINGRAVIGAQPFEVFKQVIDEELAKK